MNVAFCALPPGDNVTDDVFAVRLIAGSAETVRLNVAVAFDTPLPLAVTVMVWLLTAGAFAVAVRPIEPEVPVPGCVMVAVTPVGSVLVARLTLPV